MAVTQYIGARYVPLFADPLEWNDTRTYEPLTIVLHKGSSYTSRQFVPIGTDIDNTDYWALTGNYNAQVEQYRQETKEAVVQVDALITKAEADVTQRLADNETAMNALDNSVKSRLTENETTVSQRLADNESAMNALDSSVANRLTDNETAMTALDNSVKSRLTENETAMTTLDNSVKSRLTENENTVSQRLTENETAVETAINTALSTVAGVTDSVGAVWELCYSNTSPKTIVIGSNINVDMNVFNDIKAGSSTHDIADYISRSTTNAKVAKAGLYKISARAYVSETASLSTAGSIEATIFGGSNSTITKKSLLNAEDAHISVCGLFNLKINDTIIFRMYNNSKARSFTCNLNNAYTSIIIEYLGSAGE